MSDKIALRRQRRPDGRTLTRVVLRRPRQRAGKGGERGLRAAIKLVRHYDLLMTLQSTPVNHYCLALATVAALHSVIIQLSVASTLLFSLTPKLPCLRSYIRQGPSDRRPPGRPSGPPGCSYRCRPRGAAERRE